MRGLRRCSMAWLAVILPLAGCVTLPTLDMLAGAGEEPVEVAVLVQPREFLDGTEPRLGLIATVLLLDPAGAPRPANGAMAFYLYLDERATEGRVEADRSWKFSDSDVEKAKITSVLGPSYRFWLPIGEFPESARRIVLMCAFVTADGRKLVGQETLSARPGRVEMRQRIERPAKPTPAPVLGAGGTGDPFSPSSPASPFAAP